jgi:O-antigen/teichoic acid export membrane protein
MRIFLRIRCRIHEKYQFWNSRPRVTFLCYFACLTWNDPYVTKGSSLTFIIRPLRTPESSTFSGLNAVRLPSLGLMVQAVCVAKKIVHGDGGGAWQTGYFLLLFHVFWLFIGKNMLWVKNNFQKWNQYFPCISGK